MRRRVPVAPMVAVVVLVLSVLPSAIVVLSSFSSNRALTFPPSHISLTAYGSLFTNGASRVALFHSLIIGLISVVGPVPLGTPAPPALPTPSLPPPPFIPPLPRVIFGSLRSALTPRLGAAGGLYIGLAVAITVILSRTGIIDRFFFQED